MKQGGWKYSRIWAALVLIIISAGLLLAWLLSLSVNLFTPLPYIFFLLIVFSAIVIFIPASRYISEQETESNIVQSSGDEGKKEARNKTHETEQLDIQSVSKKIIRRTTIKENSDWGNDLLNQVVAELEIMSGVFYLRDTDEIYRARASYAHPLSEEPYSFREGEGLTGHVAQSKQVKVFRSIPDDYTNVFSGLGQTKPGYLAIVPFLQNNQVLAILELAGFRWSEAKLEQLFQILSRDISADLELNSKDANSISKSEKEGEHD